MLINEIIKLNLCEWILIKYSLLVYLPKQNCLYDFHQITERTFSNDIQKYFSL